MKKRGLSSSRPTGRLDPDPKELAQARRDLAAFQQQAQQGKIIFLYEDETILWRFALPRAGWWRTAHRHRLATEAFRHRQIKQHEALKRPAWQHHRSWGRLRAGVLLSVLGAVQYGTNKVCWTVVPHVDTYEFRQFIHQLMHTCGKGMQPRPVVLVADRSGMHRAKARQATLSHYQDRFRFSLLPARAGHHLNPIEGFWRVLKDTSGAGRCFASLHQLYQRTRRVLLTHQEQPIYHFPWSDCASNFV